MISSKIILRRQSILAFINEKGDSSLDQICDAFNLSVVTARRELKALEENNEVWKIGRNIFSANKKFLTSDNNNWPREHSLMASAIVNVLEKNCIVFLGPEEFNDLIAEHMIKAKRGLTVIASNIRHASIMRSQGGQDVYLVGGRIDSNTGIVYGSFAEDMISSMISDIAIFGCKSINPQKGIIFETDLESQILSKVKSFSRKIIMIADHTQFLENSSGSIFKFDKSMTIFSDDEVKPKFINELKSSGINIIQAKHLTRESLYEAN